MLSTYNNIYKKWLCLFSLGFIVGIFLTNFQSSVFAGEYGLFNETSLNRLKYLEIENYTFFRYVTAMRVKDYLLVGLLSITCIGLVVSYGAVAWQGMLMGMVVTVAVIRFGMKGLLLVLVSFFPHQLLLLPAGMMMLLWCCQNYSLFCMTGKRLWLSGPNKKYFIRQFLMLIWILAVVMIGCVLESYVNPLLISDVVKFF